MYQERPSHLRGAFVWSSSLEARSTRVLPDGCMDLIWANGAVLVAGPDTRAFVHSGHPGDQLLGLRFAPGFAPHVLGRPAHEFLDQRVPLDDVWPRARVDQLVDRLHRAPRPGSVLEAEAAQLTMDVGEPMGLLDHIVSRARRGDAAASIAEAVGYSDRQLHRRCREAFGYGAKRLTRILRLGQAVDLARRGATFSHAAYQAGYADQAHLAREVKELAGVPLSQLLAET